jgi:hypothetical protein
MLTMAAAVTCPDHQKQLCYTCSAGVRQSNAMLGAAAALDSYACAMQCLQENLGVNISLRHVSEQHNSQCWIQEQTNMENGSAHWATTAGGHERENVE